MRKNVAGQNVGGVVIDKTTGAGLTTSVTVYVTGDNGTQTAGAGTTTHKGNGQWDYAPTQAETNYSHVVFLFTHATGIPAPVNVYPTAADPGDAAGLGLSRLDAAVTTRMATFTLPTNFATLVIDANGRVDLSKWIGVAVNALIAGRVDAIASVLGVDAVDATALAASAAAEIADKILGRSIAGGADGGRTVQDALRILRNRRKIAAGTLTVYQ